MKTDSTFSAKAGRGWLCFVRLIFVAAFALFSFSRAQAQLFVPLPALPQFMQSTQAWGDPDHDGDPDLFLQGRDSAGVLQTRLLENGGMGFADLPHSIPVLFFSSATWFDGNGDGFDDLAVTGKTTQGQQRFFFFVGSSAGLSGSFQELPGIEQGCLLSADYDWDGDVDLMGVGYNNLEGLVALFYQNQSGNFSVSRVSSVRGASGATAVSADIDLDGRPDLVVSGTEGDFNRHLRFYRNATPSAGFSPSFSERNTGLENRWCDGVSAGFANGDNLPDLVLCGSGRGFETVLLLNNGDFSFQESSQGLSGIGLGKAVFADYDADGDADLALCGMAQGGGNTAKVFTNSGSGVFAANPSALQSGYHAQITWADVDGDNDLDFILSGTSQTELPFTILYRNNNGTFQP